MHRPPGSDRSDAAGRTGHPVAIGEMQLNSPATISDNEDDQNYRGGLFDLLEYSGNLPGNPRPSVKSIAFVAVLSESSNCRKALQVSRKAWLVSSITNSAGMERE